MNAEPVEASDARSTGKLVDRRDRHTLAINDVLVEFGRSGLTAPIVQNWDLGPVRVLRLEAVDLSLTTLAASSAQLAVIQSGGASIDANGQMRRAGAPGIVLIDADAPHQLRFDPHSEAVLLSMARKQLADRGLRERRVGLVLPDMADEDVRAVVETVVMMGRQSGRTSLELRRRQGELLLDMVSVIINDPSSLVRPRSAYATLVRAKRFISRNLGNVELRVNHIASAIGTSEAHLHRLFRADGDSPMRYLLGRRLQMAAELLTRAANRGLQIKEVAYRCGFTSHAHFSRSFRQRFGVSPKAAATAGLAIAHLSADDPAR